MNIKDITITSNSTIKDALKIIDKGAVRIAVVIDKDKRVIGTLSDGDIRRAFLKNYSFDSKIEDIYYKNPVIAYSDEPKEKIIKKAIKNRVYQIPIVDKKNRLIDLVDLASLIEITKKDNIVFLMAGGLGTRLRPLTNEVPKPLLNVGNRPILETIIRNFAEYGFVNIVISVNYKSQMIKEYFKDGSDFGVEISYIEESKRLGTAGALSLMKDIPKKPFFVMNADILTNINFDNLLDFHIKENSTATMCVKEYSIQIPYGVINTDGSKIVSIVEKPKQSFFINAGIYVLSPKVFDFIPKNTFFDMPTLFQKLIKKNKKTTSFPIREYWLDIGQISDFKQAQNEFFEVFDE